jgi:hypothetical protein
MHRSGTSLVSRLLNLLGVEIGPEEAMWPLVPSNAKGLWEHRPMVELNDEVLAAFGGRWDSPPDMPGGWIDDPRTRAIAARARRLVDEQFSAHPTWGWKDPRTCLTLPFWHRTLGPMRHVVCLRNPSAVIASLGRRDGIPSDQAESLWLAYVRAGLAHTSGHPRLFVFYEDVLDDWLRELRRLAHFVGRPDRIDDPRVRAEAARFVDAALCHHPATILDLAGEPRVSAITASLFIALRSLAAHVHDPAGPAYSDDAGRCASEAMDRLADRAEREWTANAALRAGAAAAAERARLAELEHARLGSEVDRLMRESADAHGTLREIRTSAAWTMVKWGRAVVVRLLPGGSRRRAAFDAILRRVVRRAAEREAA